VWVRPSMRNGHAGRRHRRFPVLGVLRNVLSRKEAHVFHGACSAAGGRRLRRSLPPGSRFADGIAGAVGGEPGPLVAELRAWPRRVENTLLTKRTVAEALDDHRAGDQFHDLGAERKRPVGGFEKVTRENGSRKVPSPLSDGCK
jgi:hypothetical protein